jgi:hypothetical protein
MLVKNEA